MTERQDTDIATAQLTDPANGQPASRPLSTADLALVDRPVPTNEMARPLASGQVRSERVSLPRDPLTAGQQAPDQSTPLFAVDRAQEYRSRWDTIQTGFVDEPRSAVEQADTLVAEVIQQLAKSFADERGKLEHDWSRGNDVSTEDLRLGLRRYRSFFDRLLTM
jgi:hypothetical protein